MRKKSWIPILLLAIAVVMVMAMIFYFSSENADESTETSNGVTAFVLKILKPDFDSLSREEKAAFFASASHYVRKAAHFTEYFLLGLFSSLLVFSIVKASGKRMGALFIIPPVFSLLYAVIDESHQTMVGGRAGQMTDVLLDTAGAVLATLIVFFIYLLVGKRMRNQ